MPLAGRTLTSPGRCSGATQEDRAATTEPSDTDTGDEASDETDEDSADAVFLDSDSFEEWTRPEVVPWDDHDYGDPEASTYPDAEHGPEPTPDWVITDAAAHDAQLGILKTGKEADVFIVERTLDDRTNLIAAKRYVPINRRSFRNQGMYRQGRRMKDAREQRAADRKTAFGVMVGANAWARNEMEQLSLLWEAGVSVPYPIQLLGSELMMEYLGDAEEAAPRLVESRPPKALLPDLYQQAIELFRGLARVGIAHGDLSPYNILLWQERLVMIDLPQAVTLAINPEALTLMHRDIVNVCRWFQRQGVEAEPGEIYREALSLIT